MRARTLLVIATLTLVATLPIPASGDIPQSCYEEPNGVDCRVDQTICTVKHLKHNFLRECYGTIGPPP